MAYSGRKRYVSRRDRLNKNMRQYRILFLFILLFVAMVVFFNWRSIVDYLMTYTY